MATKYYLSSMTMTMDSGTAHCHVDLRDILINFRKAILSAFLLLCSHLLCLDFAFNTATGMYRYVDLQGYVDLPSPYQVDLSLW